MGRFHPLATADSIYSDENNFLSLALSTSSTSSPLPPATPPTAKNNKRQKEEVEGGGGLSTLIELSAESWVS